MKKPKACVLITKGSNCYSETAMAINLAGANADIVHINSMIKKFDPIENKKVSLQDYHMLVVPGGFTYGDDVGAGKIYAQMIMKHLGDDITKFKEDGKLIIGICNGFQVLVKMGLLPGYSNQQEVTLTYNNIRKFHCNWVKLQVPENNSIWTKGINSIDVPVAHAEGQFKASDDIVKKLFENGQVVFRYASSNGNATVEYPANPNGSQNAIAAISDESGRILGMMPHPERFIEPGNHPNSDLQTILARPYLDRENEYVQRKIAEVGKLPKEGAGLKIFQNGVKYAIDNLM